MIALGGLLISPVNSMPFIAIGQTPWLLIGYAALCVVVLVATFAWPQNPSKAGQE
jgi:hypothetical protein